MNTKGLKNQLLSKSNTVIFSLFFIFFVIFQCLHLNTAYFWDEMWVYAPSIQFMAEAGPSMLPGILKVEFARGHPLFFHFIGGLWIKIFGNHQISLHSFSLFITLSYLATIYYGLKIIFNSKVAILVAIFTGSTALFVAQSNMVLPEVLIGLLSLSSIILFASSKYVPAFISCSLLILSKESGLVIVPALLLSSIILFVLDEQRSWKKLSLDSLTAIAAIFPYLLFLLLQKSIYGWYFYPDHMGYILSNIYQINDRFVEIFEWLISSQNRNYIFNTFIVIGIYYLIQEKHYKTCIALCISMIMITLDILLFPFIGCCIFILVLIYKAHQMYDSTSSQKRFVTCTAVFTIGYLLFYSINFTTSRYLIGILPLSIFSVIYLCYGLVKMKHLHHFMLLLAVPLLIFTNQTKDAKNIRDIDLSYYNANHIMKDAFQYLESISSQDDCIYTNFLIRQAFEHIESGYKTTADKYTCVNHWNKDNKVFDSKYFVADNFSDERLYNSFQKRDDIALIKSFKKGTSVIDVYEKK